MKLWLINVQSVILTDCSAVLPRDGLRLGILLSRHGHSLDNIGLRRQFEAFVLDVDKEHDGRNEVASGGGPIREACEAGIGDDTVDALKQRLNSYAISRLKGRKKRSVLSKKQLGADMSYPDARSLIQYNITH